MKWFAQHFLSPLFAACVAIWGSYYFIHKDEIRKEYTKIGIDILLRENAPESVKALGAVILEQNSPVNISSAEKEAKLRDLMKNIPFEHEFPNDITFGEITARYAVLAEWAAKVARICPECINQVQFNHRFKEVKKQIYESARKGKQSAN